MEMWVRGPIDCLHYHLSHGLLERISHDNGVSTSFRLQEAFFGSMGARSFIVRGKANPEGLSSCSHGAGRAMSRNESKRRFTVEDHMRMTEGVECRKDRDVIGERRAHGVFHHS
jgi:hypothetical protein